MPSLSTDQSRIQAISQSTSRSKQAPLIDQARILVGSRSRHPTNGWAADEEITPISPIREEDAREQLKSAEKLRTEGNRKMKVGQAYSAAALYARALDEVHFVPPSAKIREEHTAEQCKLWLNMAAASIKLEQFSAAEEWAERVLQVSPDNNKAVYRRAVARLELGRYHECEADVL
eukprot:CAMPEP_0174758586 /NCGR_PEP_ID=MMETSP1094-20130205/107840_1 /TAXON_ID=156173 /ORGANISM="Chrysochromulina brevifilum, Strain UTEX LB 985" /LENGTH=175 /DNA_ID=CAMNT_0015964513 /DNA_START=506 /DNA_END=1030 /DNA_ORIENTATION=+